MIFQRALRRELISAAGAVFTTLFTITITFMLMKTLGQAASGKVASQDVVALLGFQALTYMPVILVLTCFISVLMAVTRSYQDSEMVVWFASGLSLTRWIRPVLAFGLPIVAVTAALTFVVAPWANRQSAEFRERFEKREDISKVSPGKFQESASADRIFFVEGVSGDATLVRNIFVNTVQNGRSSVVVAKEGTVSLDPNGDKFLVMSQGRRYDGLTSQNDFRVMEFERYGVLVGRQSETVVGDKSARSLSTPALLSDMNPFNRGELLWRVSVPLMCLLLLLLAIPLGFVNPRGGRSANLMVALLIFVIYLNMVNVFQASVVQQRLPLGMAWWPIHLLAFLLLALLFSWRLFLNSPRHPAAMWGRFKRAWLFRKAEAQ
ncbi:LPS export ABC transporter permease LptF [Noviherbaspirillum galbum]|uniref:Lipopolysaccharide export system permease protein LptF n=1 Tax=Noviherbaspirillum galbum TaxID=2709383 RepID=A0A6B3SMW6_9BURK|nr:LPS export ABC transporter permease LptF [Noviherbaspirillum galbum]NEX62061.1 LPS export ABC transporter permease LptF [Noviherbaspirillum galbum]